MGFERDFLTLMPETVLWATRGTLDDYGVPTWSTTYSTQRTWRGRVVYRAAEVRSDDGRETVEAQGVVYCVPTVTGSTFVPRTIDRLRLPNGDTPPILRVESFPDEDGTHHYQVTFGYSVRG